MVEVSTYVIDDMARLTPDLGAARLRAYTRLTPAGEVVTCVPEGSGAADQAVWTLHADMVKAASCLLGHGLHPGGPQAPAEE